MGICSGKPSRHQYAAKDDTNNNNIPSSSNTDDDDNSSIIQSSRRIPKPWKHSTNLRLTYVPVTSNETSSQLGIGTDDGSVYTISLTTLDPIVTNSWKNIHSKSIQALSSFNSDIYVASRDCSISHLRGGRTGVLDKSGTGIHTLSINALDVERVTGASLVSGGRDTLLAIWDTSTSLSKPTLQSKLSRNIITCAKWIDPHVVASGAEDLHVRFWDTRQSMKNPTSVVSGYTYFPLSMNTTTSFDSNNYVVTSSKGFNAVGCEIRVIDTRTNSFVHEFTGHLQDATSVAFLSKDSSSLPLIVSVSKDSTVRVWDCNNSSTNAVVRHDEVSAGMFTSVVVDKSNNIYASTFGGDVFHYKYSGKALNLIRSTTSTSN